MLNIPLKNQVVSFHLLPLVALQQKSVWAEVDMKIASCGNIPAQFEAIQEHDF